MAVTKAFKTEYAAWINMKHRCFNTNNRQYQDYGGRGITVCTEWRHDFMSFLNHVGKKPSPDLTLERLDNDGHYEPGNVKWDTRSAQQKNRRANIRSTRSHLLTHRSQTKSIAEWSRDIGIPYSTIQRRLSSGWCIDRVLSK